MVSKPDEGVDAPCAPYLEKAAHHAGPSVHRPVRLLSPVQPDGCGRSASLCHGYGDTIAVAPLVITAALCGDEALDTQATEYLAALTASVTATRGRTSLQLFDADGAITGRYTVHLPEAQGAAGEGEPRTPFG